jgi:hypothetical protein
MFFIYLGSLVVLVSGAILVIALPRFSSTQSSEAGDSSFEGGSALRLARVSVRSTHSLPKPPPLDCVPENPTNFLPRRGRQ